MLPIRFINLDRATERRAFMDEQGRRLGLTMERVRAIEAGDIAPGELERLAGSWQRPMTAGEVACFLSHRAEWQRVASEDRPALILEDDALFSRRFAEVLPRAAAMTGAELLNLEDVGKRRFLSGAPGESLGAGVSAVRCFRDKAGAGAYILWPAGARRLLDSSRERAGLADAILHGSGLRAFVCEPPVSMQLSVMELRGLSGPIDGQSLLQSAAREKAPGTSVIFALRRAAAQLKLLPHHLRRLGPGDYRRVEVEEADFQSRS